MKWPDVLDFQSIRGKLFVALTGLVLAISLMIYLYFPRKLKASALDASLDKIQKVTEMIAYSIAPAMDSRIPPRSRKSSTTPAIIRTCSTSWPMTDPMSF